MNRVNSKLFEQEVINTILRKDKEEAQEQELDNNFDHVENLKNLNKLNSGSLNNSIRNEGDPLINNIQNDINNEKNNRQGDMYEGGQEGLTLARSKRRNLSQKRKTYTTKDAIYSVFC